MRTRRAFALAAIAAALATPALAASGAATGAVVTATNFQWSPSSLTVLAGEPVTFANGGGFHTWERDDGTDSCGLPCTRAFAPGTVAYHCGVHPGMRGVLRVASGAAPDLAVTAADGATGDARSTSVRWRVENVGLT
ncbi:MAG TPA: hypothetical protein VHH36_02480, partial [Candidatus Thermoplasmatota archaeon]|nr:hypothetical protein [Candidatus Thermoplasmatota archaeon]